jgi:hypothetical protein
LEPFALKLHALWLSSLGSRALEICNFGCLVFKRTEVRMGSWRSVKWSYIIVCNDGRWFRWQRMRENLRSCRTPTGARGALGMREADAVLLLSGSVWPVWRLAAGASLSTSTERLLERCRFSSAASISVIQCRMYGKSRMSGRLPPVKKARTCAITYGPQLVLSRWICCLFSF